MRQCIGVARRAARLAKASVRLALLPPTVLVLVIAHLLEDEPYFRM